MSDYVFDFIVIFVIGLLIYKFISILKAIKQLRQRNNINDLSGCEIASKMLENNKYDDIYIVKTSNPFSEGYNSNRNTIKLSDGCFDNTTISDMILVSRLCSKIILSKHNKGINLKINIIKLLDIINILIYFGVILFSILKYMYYLKITLIGFVITILIRLLFISYEKEVNKTAIKELKKLDLIDEINKDRIDNLFNELSFDVVVKPILIVYDLYRYINNKTK